MSDSKNKTSTNLKQISKSIQQVIVNRPDMKLIELEQFFDLFAQNKSDKHSADKVKEIVLSIDTSSYTTEEVEVVQAVKNAVGA